MSRPIGGDRIVPGIPGAAVLGTLALGSGVALTATSGWLIVAASFRPQILTLIAAIVLVRGFGTARPALRYAERVRSHDAALRYLAQARTRTYARLVPLTPARLGRRGRADVLAGVVDDLDDLAFAQVRVVVPLASLVGVGLLAALAVALVFLPGAAVIASLVACAGLVGLADAWCERRTRHEVVEARAEVTRWAALATTQALEIAAVGGAADVERRLAAAQGRLDRALRREASGRAIGTGAMPVVVIAHTVLMAMLVEPWIARGLPTPLAALVVLTPVALGEVVGVVPDAVGSLVRAQGAAARLDRLLRRTPAVAAEEATPPEGPGGPSDGDGGAGPSGIDTSSGGDGDAGPRPGPTPPRLRLEGVRATWDGRRPALPRLDLDLAPGEFVAVTGANGSGKSTLLAVLARQLDPSAGTYTADGADQLARPLAHARAELAVVDDEPHVFASTLRENLRLARPEASDDDLWAALDRAGLTRWARGLPDGLDTRLGTGGRGVSGGERARLGIARAHVSGRPVVLLDEPVAHLDPPTARAVLDELAATTRGRTVVLVAHRADGLEHASRHLELGPGESGTTGPEPSAAHEREQDSHGGR